MKRLLKRPSSVPNRWVIAYTAFGMQLALGALYAWSVFLKPVMTVYGVSKLQANLTYTISIIAVGVIAGFGGALQQHLGPRTIATVGGVLYGLGLSLAGLTTSFHVVFVLYLTYGLVGGIGVGLAYIVPLAMLIAWFPDRRGFITGLTVSGFGLGAFVLSPLAALLIERVGLGNTFTLLGAVYLLVTVLAAQGFRRAPDDYTPPGWTPSARQQITQAVPDRTLAQAVRSPIWYILWLMILVHTLAGAALISVASPLAQERTHVDAVTAAFLVSTISIFNGIGRLFWGWLSDTIGRLSTFVSLFLIQVIAFLTIPHIETFGVLLLPAAAVSLCYGGGFGTMPAFTADVFGVRHAGTIYGVILIAWSIGSILGPLLIASLPTEMAIYLIAGVLLASLVLPLIARFLLRRAETPYVKIGS